MVHKNNSGSHVKVVLMHDTAGKAHRSDPSTNHRILPKTRLHLWCPEVITHNSSFGAVFCYNKSYDKSDGERVTSALLHRCKNRQNKEVFQYSIDSVLLSRFPKIPEGLIVDLCSGNGAVGLFASTCAEAPITLDLRLQERLTYYINQLEDFPGDGCQWRPEKFVTMLHDLRWTLFSGLLLWAEASKNLSEHYLWPVTKSRLIWNSPGRLCPQI